MTSKGAISFLGLAAWIAALGLFAAGEVRKPDLKNCAGFTVADAAEVLNLPAASITAKSEKIHDTLWMCTFSSPKTTMSFSLELAASAAEASADMARYRENLEVAAGTAPYKGRLPKGAWSEITPLGEENTWTDINHTLTVRQGSLTIQVQPPMEKLEQVKLVRVFLKRLQAK